MGSFHGNGLGQVAGLVYVAAATDGDVIGQELQRNNFEEWNQEFGCGRQFDQVVGGFSG
jgi:hypothetical protein